MRVGVRDIQWGREGGSGRLPLVAGTEGLQISHHRAVNRQATTGVGEEGLQEDKPRHEPSQVRFGLGRLDSSLSQCCIIPGGMLARLFMVMGIGTWVWLHSQGQMVGIS